MSFGTIIKRLRRERDLTQEELAERLGLSPQAVSRWETNAALPDISMIPVLCRFFGVSSDHLLEIDTENRKQKIDGLREQAGRYSSRGFPEQAAEVLTAGLREYPDSFEIMYDLMYVRDMQSMADSGRTEFRKEAEKLGERILAECTDDSLREGATQVLCFCYSSEGRIEDAVALAEKVPCMACSRELLLCNIYSGEKGHEASMSLILQLVQFLSNRLRFLGWDRNDAGECLYSEAEREEMNEKRIALLKLFFEDGNLGFYHDHLYEAYRAQTEYLAKKGETEQAVRALRSAADQALAFDRFAENGKGQYTCLLFRDHPYGSWSSGDADNNAAKLLGCLEDPLFDRMRERPEFAEIKTLLEENAAQWKIR